MLQLLTLHSQLMSGAGGCAPPLRLLASGAVELLSSRVFALLEPGCEAEKDRAISLLLPAVVVYLNVIFVFVYCLCFDIEELIFLFRLMVDCNSYKKQHLLLWLRWFQPH